MTAEHPGTNCIPPFFLGIAEGALCVALCLGASDAVAFILGDASMHPGTSCFLHDEAISKAALLGAVSEAGGGAVGSRDSGTIVVFV